MSICDGTGRWKPDPIASICHNSSTINIPSTTNYIYNDYTGPGPGQDLIYTSQSEPTMPELIPSFSLYILAGLVVLTLFLFAVTLSIIAIIWQLLKRNKNAPTTTQRVDRAHL